MPALAQKPAERPSAADPDFSKEAYTIERLATRITAEGNGTGSREVNAEVKILADAGVKAFAVLNFTYTSANETVEIVYVRVRKPDGSVVTTPDYNIQDMPAEVTRAAPLYSDIHEKHVAVKGLSVGDVLEYLVRYRIVKPEVPGQFWYEHSFMKDAIVKDERLEISVPGDKYLKVASPEFKPELQEEGARRIYRWKHVNLAVKERDPNEAPRRIPLNPDVQVTTFANWEDVGKWYRELQKDPLQVTPAIQAKAAELTKGLITDEERIHALYSFVSLKYHYVGLDFGIGRYQPHAADDVLENGYGDCKDKHTLLASLLQAIGIEAWPVLIHTNRKLDPDVPSPAQFNHVITVVPHGGEFLWLDTTPEVSPFRLILLNLRNKQALVIPAAKPPLLMTTPENPPFPQGQEFSMSGKLSADGTFRGHAEQSYRGDAEVLLREIFRGVSQSQWKETMQRISYGLNFGGDVSNVTITPPDDLEKPFKLSYDYVRKKYGDWDNHQIIPPLPPMGIEFAKDSKEKKPLDPVLLGAVGKITYRSRVELPAGFTAMAPARCHLAESYAEFTDDTRIESGVMTTAREFIIKRSEVALSDWAGFYKFGRAIYDAEAGFIRLNRTQSPIEDKPEDPAGQEDVDRLFDLGREALQRNDSQHARELLEKVIAKDPRHPAAHLNLGVALMLQNRPVDALAELLKEEEISPNDPRSFQMAAAVAGFTGKKDQAIDQLRKLLKLNPENSMAAASLGDFLSEQGNYREALEVLEAAVKAAPDSPSLQYQLGTTYLKTGQKDKAVSCLQEAVKQGGADAMLLNNVAYALADNKISLDLARQYAEKSLKEIEERSAHEVKDGTAGARAAYELSLIWDTAGWAYFQSGDMNRAESFVRAAWLLRQEPVVGEHLGEIYEKQGKSKAAASAYALALAAIEASPPWPQIRSSFGVPVAFAPDANGRKALTQELTARYKKLTGREPAIRESVRLRNGGWTKSVSEQLTQLRTVSLGKQPDLSGSAEFSIVFAPGKIEAVEYASGEKSLTALIEKIKTGSFQLEFPVDSQAKIVRRIQVGCFRLSGCMAVLTPVSAASAARGWQFFQP